MKKTLVLVSLLFLIAASCKKETTEPSSTAPTPAPAPAKPAAVTSSLPPNSWQVPVDVTPTPPPNPPQANYINLGWQTFVALSWPAVAPASGGNNGQPDTSLSIGAQASNGAFIPTVWASYRDIDTVMLNNGTDPGASYTQAVTIPSGCTAIGSSPVAPGFMPMYINGSTFTQATIPKDYINQATNNPLVDQEGWYTLTNIRINQSEYEYIQTNGYYLGQNQVNAYTKNGQLQPFPKTGTQSGQPPYAQYGALEIKSAWRILDPQKDAAVIPRYYTQWGYFMQPDGKTCQGPSLFGLIGLHILRLTPSMGGTWFWASFEQVDNTEPPAGTPATLETANTPNGNCTTPPYNVGPTGVTGNIPWSGTNTPDNLCQVTQIPADVASANTQWQTTLGNTVWKYYQMVNTLNPCPSGASNCYTFPPIYDSTNTVNTNVFANTAIESYFQTHSCLDCHGGAAGNGAPTKMTGTNQIFTFVLLNAYYPQPTAAATRTNFKALFKKPPSSKAAAATPVTKNK